MFYLWAIPSFIVAWLLIGFISVVCLCRLDSSRNSGGYYVGRNPSNGTIIGHALFGPFALLLLLIALPVEGIVWVARKCRKPGREPFMKRRSIFAFIANFGRKEKERY